MLLSIFIIITIIMIIGEIFPNQTLSFFHKYFDIDPVLTGSFFQVWRFVVIGYLIYYFFLT
jgi:hypothetical protein